jgi:hypothetical protein
MKCPHCHGETHILETRGKNKRRRQCLLDNSHRFTTVELIITEDISIPQIQYLIDRRFLIDEAVKKFSSDVSRHLKQRHENDSPLPR